MAANKLGYGGLVRDTFLASERGTPSARAQRIAATFDPASRRDDAVGIDDIYGAVVKYAGQAAGAAGAAGGFAEHVAGPLSDPLSSLIKYAEVPIGAAADLVQGRSVPETLSRAGAGLGITVSAGVSGLRLCPKLRNPYLIGGCVIRRARSGRLRR